MKDSFVWTDLSTYDVRTAKAFYEKCFGWKYNQLAQDYLICGTHQEPAAGIFPMPQKFQALKMPSFWMSYILVEKIGHTVKLAQSLGGKIELPPQTAPGGGRIALIRDPAGAGFTCYEGTVLNKTTDPKIPGEPIWHELHISDLSKIQNFYTQLFDWNIRPSPQPNRFEIYNSLNRKLAGIQVTPNDIKGDKEYWGVYFLVSDLLTMKDRITQAGGEYYEQDPIGASRTAIVYDSQGAALYLLENTSDRPLPKRPSKLKWRATLGLILIISAIIFEANWFWGLLFLLWLIPDIKTGITYFLEPIDRRENPYLYWTIITTWVFLSLYLFFNL
ncbi:MAG: VOC family protein [Cyanobacteria bacterium P01_H01_bin.15]